jgi:hypothetical protein
MKQLLTALTNMSRQQKEHGTSMIRKTQSPFQ